VEITGPILYVEDERDDVFFMQFALEEAGVRNPLVALKDGRLAMEYLSGTGQFADRAKHPFPCLMLLDLNLPIQTGFEVLAWLREQTALPPLPVVVVSGSNQETDVEAVKTLGALDYVVKPASPMELIEIVRKRKAGWLGEKE
jgi:CheY-like chemotaxis protein